MMLMMLKMLMMMMMMITITLIIKPKNNNLMSKKLSMTKEKIKDNKKIKSILINNLIQNHLIKMKNRLQKLKYYKMK